MSKDLIARLRDYINDVDDIDLRKEAADRIEQLEHNYASLQQAFDEMKKLAAQRLEALEESRANDRTAMSYLAEVRAIVGGDDFPDMVLRVKEAERQRDELLTLLEEGATGFGRILVATSDDKAVRNWQKRSNAAIEAARKEQR